MKKGIYRTLAWNGIVKNRKLYLPYILACIGTVMMCYIISFLSISPTFSDIKGGKTMQSFLSMGFGVMCVFSVIFLFYTNSFLIRRRKKEFGLYNILGLGKKNLALVLGLETLIIAVMAMAGGLFFGILFSKFAELCMVKVLNGTVSFVFSIEISSIFQTVLLFLGIFFLLFLNTLRQIQLTNPIQLLHSENTGEKPPKGNWILAIFGIAFLACAYYLAITIEDPVTALTAFFFAVILVVIATYLLFISGSVTLCRVLQKNKRYYYKTNHFVSISSMVYRMKRNGAGLASICILCTMVLVMISSTVCLYYGAEDNLRNRYPRNINIDAVVSNLDLLSGEQINTTKKIVQKVVEENETMQKNILTYRTAALAALIEENQLIVDESIYQNSMDKMSKIWQVFIVPLSDYNRLMGEEEKLNSDEVLIYTTKEMDYDQGTIKLGKDICLSVKSRVQDFVDNGVDSMQIFPTIYLFVTDFEKVVQTLEKDATIGEQGLVSLHWYYGFDLPCNDDLQQLIQQEITDQCSQMEESFNDFAYFHILVEGVAKERADFYGIYGGLFFLGILLGVVFICAAVLIIYYKQVSEGYEDQSKFEIMKKIGMTKKEIKKSINSQILTVFFLPLITAGVHLAFAFPLIRKLLLILGLTNYQLLFFVTICSYLVFAFFYMIVYRLTSHSYFTIVNGLRNQVEA